MTTLKLLAFIAMFTCLACRQKNAANPSNMHSAESTANSNHLQRSKLPFPEAESIIFGNYCGESDNSTWTNRYKLLLNDTVLLFTDTLHKKVMIDTSAYLTPLLDKHKVDIAVNLLKSIPMQLLQDTINTQYFSCNDCPHYCTTFFELQTKTGGKKIYFSHEYKNIKPEIDSFRKTLGVAMSQMLQ